MKTIGELQDEAGWPDAVRFLPFVGDRYLEGFDGTRVLILGESHYVSDWAEFEKFGERGFTRYLCSDLASSDERDDRQFFRYLDAVVARAANPSLLQAKEGWAHVAFANFVQIPVGNRADDRPRSEQWQSGRDAWPHLMEHLRPHAVLVVGRQNFDNTPEEQSDFLGFLDAPLVRRERSLYEVKYRAGTALMSWIYHTARTNERADERVSVFDALLAKAKQWKVEE